MIKDTQLFKGSSGLAKALVIYEEVCMKGRCMDFDLFKQGLALVGARKKTRYEDVAAFLIACATTMMTTAASSTSSLASGDSNVTNARVAKGQGKGQGKGNIVNKKAAAQPASTIAPPPQPPPAAAPAAGIPSFKNFAKSNAANSEYEEKVKKALKELNKNLAEKTPVPESELCAGGFSWEAKERLSTKLKDDASSWGWAV